ncbi:MAG: HIT domain-containing protein [Actinobacteria bacterium]|nr:HIT domain-containing protein [Actinomycetota bacterium]NIS29920.1 HIT domain-containing protein [Actinomycetota bacterium]NIT94768.1 HIT domain-containing protein [Actinomycetota bacterium]NIU18428.1 HIT domain-containing protein [Actinomycetota bacterium]NIU65204.1 HIT domain-containing protein [Actinomycetota bacterium]
MVEHLWAGWRIPYIESGEAAGKGVPEGTTLFEAILASGRPDSETWIVWRGETCFALLNAYPYTSGHLMVLPYRGVAALSDLTDAEHSEMWEGVRAAVAALETAYRPEGVNIGVNIGRAAGAGVPDHVHVHVVPRWRGDTNFTTAVANVRVMPESLDDTWRRLTAAWPT